MTYVHPRLDGAVALVTGAAKRLGRAIALALAADGADVIVHYNRSEVEATALAADIRRLGRQAWPLAADLADVDQADQLIDRAASLAGRVGILVNNASIFPTGRITEAPVDDFLANLQVHAIAPLLLSRRFAAQAEDGHIVNMLDSRIHDYDREHAAYHISKRALFTLTRMLALELAPHVAVNAVAPGLILPPAGEDESYLQRLASTNPLNRYGDAEDIADAVRFLLGSRFITGQVIYVDGGRHLTSGAPHA
jgi:pteridine reductase